MDRDQSAQPGTGGAEHMGRGPEELISPASRPDEGLRENAAGQGGLGRNRLASEDELGGSESEERGKQETD